MVSAVVIEDNAIIGIPAVVGSTRTARASANPSAGHLQVGDNEIELAPAANLEERLLSLARGGHVVACGTQHRDQHVAEEGGIVDQQHVRLCTFSGVTARVKPVGKGERQIMRNVHDVGRLALDDRRTQNTRPIVGGIDVQLLLDDVDDLIDDQSH